MATFNGTTGNDVANITGPTLTGFTTGVPANDLALLTDGIGDTFNGGAGIDIDFVDGGYDTIFWRSRQRYAQRRRGKRQN